MLPWLPSAPSSPTDFSISRWCTASSAAAAPPAAASLDGCARNPRRARRCSPARCHRAARARVRAALAQLIRCAPAAGHVVLPQQAQDVGDRHGGRRRARAASQRSHDQRHFGVTRAAFARGLAGNGDEGTGWRIGSGGQRGVHLEATVLPALPRWQRVECASRGRGGRRQRCRGSRWRSASNGAGQGRPGIGQVRRGSARRQPARQHECDDAPASSPAEKNAASQYSLRVDVLLQRTHPSTHPACPHPCPGRCAGSLQSTSAAAYGLEQTGQGFSPMRRALTHWTNAYTGSVPSGTWFFRSFPWAPHAGPFSWSPDQGPPSRGGRAGPWWITPPWRRRTGRSSPTFPFRHGAVARTARAFPGWAFRPGRRAWRAWPGPPRPR